MGSDIALTGDSGAGGYDQAFTRASFRASKDTNDEWGLQLHEKLTNVFNVV